VKNKYKRKTLQQALVYLVLE